MSKVFVSCLVFLVLSYLPFANQVSLVINAAFFLNFSLSLWQESGKRKIPIYLRIGLMAAGIALIFREYQTLWGLEPGVALLSLMATLKIFELKERRDFFLFVLIVELSLIGHVLTVDDLYMVAYVIFLSLALFGLLFTFYTGEGRVDWGRERRKVFIQIFLTSIPLAAFLFFLFPRLTLGNLFFNTVKKANMTGFSDEIRPGTISEVVNNPTPYFRAKFLNDKVPSYFELYWRGAILSRTSDGMTWKRGKPPGTPIEVFSGPVKYEYLVTYDHFMNSPLFFLENTFDFDKKSKGYLIDMGGGTFKFFPYSNQKTSYLGKTGKSRPLEMTAKQRDHYLKLPNKERIKRFLNWAESIPKGNALTLSKAFGQYLVEKKFNYTLSPGLLNSDQPLDEFFFESRSGFCEHFSAAFALFLRAKGIPSRVVVGFHGGEFNPLGQYYVVKGMDAHAWVEAWSPKKGWNRFDPTGWVAPDRIRYGSMAYFVSDQERQAVSLDVYLEQRNNEFIQGLLFAIDMFYYEANREFIGFDLNRQEELFSFLGTEGRRFPWKLLLASVFISLLFGLPLYFRLKKSSEHKLPEFNLYHQLHTKLAKGGFFPQASWGPARRMQEASQFFPDNASTITLAYEIFIELCYAPQENLSGGGRRAEKLEEFRTVVKSLRIPYSRIKKSEVDL